MRTRDALVAFALVSSFPLAARADDEIDPASLKAEKLAETAEAKVAAGAFDEALALYVDAYQASPAAVIAFDIAWLYDVKLGAPDLAVEYYQKAAASLDAEPELAARANDRIAALRAKPKPVDKPPAAAPSPLRTWGLVAGGAGLVALGAGVVFAIVAKSKDDEANKYCDGDRCTDARALSLTDEASSAARTSTILVVAGGVLAAGGAALFFLSPKPGKPAIGVSGTSLVLFGTFR